MSGIDLQPTLAGPRVIVRPIVPADWSGMYSAACDPEIWRQHPASDRYLEPVFRAYFDNAIASDSAFTIIDRASGVIIGSSRYHGLNTQAREIEIGWTFLARAFWGGSYNREIKQLMLDHAFTFVDAVVFWVGESNHRSQRAMEKIGAVLRDGFHRRDLRDPSRSLIYEIRQSLGD